MTSYGGRPYPDGLYRGPTTSGGGGGGGPPTVGLKLWLKADAGITLAGSKVAGWADQSGNGNDVSQATGANQPTFNAVVLNGLPGVTFSGSTQVLAGAANLVANGAARHVFLLVKVGTVGGVPLTFKKATPYFACELFSSGGNVFVYSDGVTISTALSTPPTITGQPYELEYASTGAGAGSFTFALNATNQTLSRTDTASDTGTTGFLVGNNGLGTDFDGSIIEILAYNAVQSGAPLTAIRTYLEARSGLPLGAP